MSVAKDLANHWTYMVFLYSEALFRFREGFITFLGRESPPSQEKSPVEKMKYEV